VSVNYKLGEAGRCKKEKRPRALKSNPIEHVDGFWGGLLDNLRFATLDSRQFSIHTLFLL
jgi:hypothetical protein